MMISNWENHLDSMAYIHVPKYFSALTLSPLKQSTDSFHEICLDDYVIS